VSKFAFNLVLFFYPSLLLFAQLEPTRNFSVKDGLPSGVVYDCLQDKQGFMWFATAAGLARFDGANFKVFTAEDGLTNNEVLQIALDPDGSIWIFPFGTTACIYDPGSQKFYTEKNYAELKKLKDLKNPMWIKNSAPGILSYSQNKAFFLENKKIRVIDKWAAVDIWPVTKDSIIFFLYDKKSYLCYLYVNNDSSRLDFPVPEAYFFSKSPDWGRWKIFANSAQTTQLNLYEYTKEGSVKQRATFTSNNLINGVIKYGQKIYITTANGIYVTDTLLNQMEYFFPGKNISKAFVDKNGNEWLCSLSGDGVYLRLKNGVKQLSRISGLAVDNVTSLRNKGDLLICGDGDGNIYTIDLQEQKIKPSYVTKLPEAVRGIELYKNSFLAYSSYKLIADNKFIPQGLGAIKSVIPDANDNLLIGSHEFLALYDKDKWKLDTIGGVERFTALSYHEDKLYYGNNKGLFEKTNYKYVYEATPVKNRSEVLKQPINYLLSTADGILWIATNSDGVVAYLKDKIIGHFNTLSIPAITSNICKKLFFDKENNSIWVVTNKGLNKISYILRGDSLSAVINLITSSEGLNDDDVNDVSVKDGKVYVATIKGICIFKIDLSKEEVPIRITDISIKDYSSPDSTGIIKSNYDLTYWQNNISISYTGICFTCNNKLIYQYRILGIGNDTLWKTTTANTVEFGELKKGRYTFQVRTTLSNIQELRFHIRPAFWQTNLFYTLVVVGVIGIFILSIKFISRQIRKREIEKTAINKKFAELEFQALQAQMNPHFVFNAMNTLQNYILKNESENASEYLAKFARLMRLFLESSRNKFIELRNEIELLRSYIELEQARLEHSFQYQINIDPNVETDIKIPSVMIQPFVENAILHGLRHKNDNNGFLELQFSAPDHVLKCRIQDNGIGREESAKINKAKDKLYKSQALDIIDEKVKALKEINNVDIKIVIEDNFKENGRGTGTIVTILFGLNN
jgi:hypothetical protein